MISHYSGGYFACSKLLKWDDLNIPMTPATLFQAPDLGWFHPSNLTGYRIFSMHMLEINDTKKWSLQRPSKMDRFMFCGLVQMPHVFSEG